jgi:hypothetical protein
VGKEPDTKLYSGLIKYLLNDLMIKYAYFHRENTLIISGDIRPLLQMPRKESQEQMQQQMKAHHQNRQSYGRPEECPRPVLIKKSFILSSKACTHLIWLNNRVS